MTGTSSAPTPSSFVYISIILLKASLHVSELFSHSEPFFMLTSS